MDINSHWNLRILAFTLPEGDIKFCIREVYYSKNGIPNGYILDKEPFVFFHELTLNLPGQDQTTQIRQSFITSLEHYKDALSKPILWGDEDKFPQPYERS